MSSAMSVLGNGLTAAANYEDALSVQEAAFSLQRRHGASEEQMLVMQANLATTYHMLGRLEEATRMLRGVYSGRLKLHGEEHAHTLTAGNNYATSLNHLRRFKEAKEVLRKTIPVARRVLGESNVLTLKTRSIYAEALYRADGATLDDLRQAVTTLEDTGRIARRVFGDAHPLTMNIEGEVQKVRAALAAREGVESIREAVEAMAPGDA